MNFAELTIVGLLGHRVKGVTARGAIAPDYALGYPLPLAGKL
jgi:hypothetical protein